MTKYYYTCEDDKKLIDDSFRYIASIIFGTSPKNRRRIEDFKEYFNMRVSNINVYPHGTQTKYINSSTPGICRLDENGKIAIEMLGHKGAPRNYKSWLKHEGAHEMCHSFVDLLPEIFSEDKEGIEVEGIKEQNHMGMIKETDAKTKKPIGQAHYGKLFNETSMDIITSMALNSFDPYSKTTVDDILKNNYKTWGNEKTGYSFMTSLTRLAIAAFSNCGLVNYNNIVNMGGSIFETRARLADNSSVYANDFLYGIVFDQLHIEKEFDRFMGKGHYRTFCEFLDRLYLKYLKTGKLPSVEVKIVMNTIPDFLNKKMQYYLEHQLLFDDDVRNIVGNFNSIWNSMQREYQAFFSNDEIEEIGKRAGK